MQPTQNIFRVIVISLAMLFTAPAMAQQVDDLERFAEPQVEQVRLLLSGYHELPERALFDQVADAPEIVEALAHGPHSPVRDRALAALGRYWPSGDVYLLYARVLADDATPTGTRHRVMVYFADAFGERAIPAIRPYLSSDDVQLRISAVGALGRIGSDEALGILDGFADRETNPVVLDAVEDASRVLR